MKKFKIKDKFNIRDKKCKILVYDEMDGYFDLYTFKREVNTQEVEDIIKKVKTELIGEWTLTDITEEIKKNFEIDNIEYFDNIKYNTINVNKIERE